MLIRLSDSARLYHGDNRDVLRQLPDNSIDSVCTDPPYALVSIVKRFGGANAAPAKGNDAYMRASAGFMGKQWDTGETAFSEEFWREVLRVLKPGGHAAAFGASRGYHRMACAIEDAGFEIRDSLLDLIDSEPLLMQFLDSLDDAQRDAFVRLMDHAMPGGQLAWLYGTGFPKGLDVSKQIDKTLGAERKVIGKDRNFGKSRLEDGKNALGDYAGEWDITEPSSPEAIKFAGFSTALKPAFEPIVLARKPLSESTVAANVLRWGTGALNIDGCRVETSAADVAEMEGRSGKSTPNKIYGANINGGGVAEGMWKPRSDGRWPANVVHDGSDEVVGAFPNSKGQLAKVGPEHGAKNSVNVYGDYGPRENFHPRGDSGSAARFFFNSKETDEQWLARNLPKSHVKPAENCFSLSSELVVSVLRNAADLSTLELVRKRTDSPAPSMNATPNELRQISDILTETMQSFARKSSLESLHEKLSLSGNPARFVATRKLTGTITITISHSKSDGSAEHVTYSITPTNSVHGAKDCAPSTTRFHYSAKASRADRAGSKHPTVKPIALMQWLARLITPPGGTVLDPFAGSGTTGAAAEREGFCAVLIEREAEYVEDIKRRFGAGAPSLSLPTSLTRLLQWNHAVASCRAPAHV